MHHTSFTRGNMRTWDCPGLVVLAPGNSFGFWTSNGAFRASRAAGDGRVRGSHYVGFSETWLMGSACRRVLVPVASELHSPLESLPVLIVC